MNSSPPMPVRQSDDRRLCDAMACYGFEHKPHQHLATYEAIVSLFRELEISPDILQVRAAGFGKGPQAFGRANKRLVTSDFSMFQGCTLYTVPAGDIVPNTHWEATCSYSLANGTGKPFLTVVMIRELFGHNIDDLLTAAKHLIDICHPPYAYTFEMPRRYGPEYYPIGLQLNTEYSPSLDSPLNTIGLRNARWLDHDICGRAWERGVIRHVYPRNLLTAPHLLFRIEGKPFADWVAARDDRGQLSDYAGGTALWEVSPEEQETVGPILLKAGMLFNPYREEWDTFQIIFPEP